MSNTMMFPAPAGSDRAQVLAAEIGCTVGEFSPPFGHMKPALVGRVAGFSKALETFGGRFERRQRVYVFPSWPTLEAALRHVLETRPPRGGAAREISAGEKGGKTGYDGERAGPLAL